MRDLRAPLVCLIAALALSGCMGRTSPVAGDPALDSMAYGQPAFAVPAPMAVAYADPAPTREAYNLGPGDRILYSLRRAAVWHDIPQRCSIGGL